MVSRYLLVGCFSVMVGCSAFLDDLLEDRPLRGPDFLLAGLLAVFAAIVLLAAVRISEGRRRHLELSRQRGRQVHELRDRFEQMHMASIGALSAALDYRDQYTGAHSNHVVELARLVGGRLGFEGRDMVDLEVAARLHDLGKLGIPDEILHKPGPLDPSEAELMRMHPIWGEQLLRRVPELERIAAIVRAEHEHWDGGGYPDGLSGEQIPAASRVILACDAYHAMTSDRPYREALSHDEAIGELRANAGSQFDPEVVEVLVETFAEVRVT